MISVQMALAIVKKMYPDKRLYGKPCYWNGMYTFRLVDKRLSDNEAKWSSRIVAVNKNTEKISEFNAFSDINFLKDARPVEI